MSSVAVTTSTMKHTSTFSPVPVDVAAIRVVTTAIEKFTRAKKNLSQRENIIVEFDQLYLFVVPLGRSDLHLLAL
jgi:hypothetical protein